MSIHASSALASHMDCEKAGRFCTAAPSLQDFLSSKTHYNTVLQPTLCTIMPRLPPESRESIGQFQSRLYRRFWAHLVQMGYDIQSFVLDLQRDDPETVRLSHEIRRAALLDDPETVWKVLSF